MSKRNENRPGYKKTKVGWIPEEWDIIQLNQLIHNDAPICYGILKPGAYVDNGVPVIKVTNYINGKINKAELHRTSPEIDSAYKRSRLLRGDVLFSIRGSVGDLTLVPPNLEGANITQDTARLRIKSSYTKDYLIHVLKSNFVRRQVVLHTIGQAVKGINIAEVKRLLIPLSSIQEQKKIAEILSTWDAAIEQTRKLIDAKKHRKKALMQQLLTGKKRLPGFYEEWTEYPMGRLFKERRETNYKHLPLLAITGNQGIIPASVIERKDSSNADKSKYKRIVPGDIGYNTMRMWQGVSAVSTLEGIVSPAYTICIPQDIVDIGFMGYFFKFPTVINLFWRYSQGLVSDTLNLKYKNFSQIEVVIPSIEEQRRIAQVLSAADNEINQHGKKLKALEKQKRGMMQKLLTGEVRAVV